MVVHKRKTVWYDFFGLYLNCWMLNCSFRAFSFKIDFFLNVKFVTFHLVGFKGHIVISYFLFFSGQRQLYFRRIWTTQTHMC